jgi:site-specific recombinase XerD
MGKLATTGGTGSALGLPIEQIAERAKGFADESRAKSTRRTYSREWAAFTAWCKVHGQAPMPATPATVALYITSRAADGRKVATIAKSLAAISQAHELAGFDSPRKAPAVRETWKGIRREQGTAPAPKSPLLVSELRSMLAAMPDTLRGKRDRAMLVMGLAGAFRRSELVALDLADIEHAAEGLRVTVRRSKTDQEAAGAVVGIPYGSDPSTCAVRLLTAWLEAAGIEDGAIFCTVDRWQNVGDRLTGQDVARAVKRAATAAELEPKRLAGHSLRSGLATQAAMDGAPLDSIMRQGRWRSSQTVLSKYIRPATVFEGNAAGAIGL